MTNVRLQKLSVLAQERRLACDDGLASLIRGVNKGKFACEAVAIVYRGAVRAFGDEAFNGAKVFSDSDQTREQYDQEVAAFFRQGTEEQFRRLVVGDGVVGSVSFNRPLRFDPALGLVNKTP